MAYTQTIGEMKELEKFTENAKKIVLSAFEQSRIEGQKIVNQAHLFVGILKNRKSIATRLLEKLGIDVTRTLDFMLNRKNFTSSNIDPFTLELSPEVKNILVDAFMISSEMGHVYVGSEHILLGLIKDEKLDFVADMNKAGINYNMMVNALHEFATYHPGVFRQTDGNSNVPGENEQQSSLETFAQNMNELARQDKFMPVYGRKKEVERLIHILSRKTKSNPILVGDAGVGKTAIVEGLVQRIVNKEVPYSFENKEIVNLDIASILAGSKIRGDIEERIIAIVREVASNPDVILFIDEIHMIIGAGTSGQGSMDIANILKPYLTNSNISVIGATTYAEYQKYFEADSALARRFQPVMVEEISPEEAVKVVNNIKPKLEQFHNVIITEEAVEDAVELSHRYVHERYLPDKAIDILDEASAAQKIANESGKNKLAKLNKEFREIQKIKDNALKNRNLAEAAELREREKKILGLLDKETNAKRNSKVPKPVVGENEIREVISKLTRIPVTKMDADEIESLKDINTSLEKNIIGQPDAIKRVSNAIKRSKIGIADTSRPMASFMFLGPTGVGKTELAKVIASEIFGSENSLIQIDMSEFMEQHSVSKLIGSPPGYIGYQDGGQLTEKVRRNPYSVILFDEIEKAHPDLLNILLQILDEGQLQDSKGRKIDFKNTIIVMTSNIGAEEVSQDGILGFHLDSDDENKEKIKEKEMTKAFEEMRTNLLDELKNTLRPELLNRIDEIIVFRGLDEKDVRQIVKLEIEKLNNRLKNQSIMIAVTGGVIDYIAEEGMSKEYGARNIRRKIQEYIEVALADLMLERRMGKQKELQIIKVNKSKDGITLK